MGVYNQGNAILLSWATVRADVCVSVCANVSNVFACLVIIVHYLCIDQNAMTHLPNCEPIGLESGTV